MTSCLLAFVVFPGQAFGRIGEMFAEQPKEDFVLMTDRLWLYKGLLDAMPDLWHVSIVKLVNFLKLYFVACSISYFLTSMIF